MLSNGVLFFAEARLGSRHRIWLQVYSVGRRLKDQQRPRSSRQVNGKIETAEQLDGFQMHGVMPSKSIQGHFRRQSLDLDLHGRLNENQTLSAIFTPLFSFRNFRV
jgi:hypothetical protein